MSANPSPKPMSEFDAKRLVKRANSGIVDAREALRELHGRQGWVALGYASFSEFVDVEIKLSRAHVYNLLTALEINTQLSTFVDTEIPETHARILAKVPEVRRKEVYAAAFMTAPTSKKLTAKHIKETAEDLDALPRKWGDRGPEQSANWGRGKSGKLELSAKFKPFEPERKTLFAWKCIEAIGHTQRWEILEECESVEDVVQETANIRTRLGL